MTMQLAVGLVVCLLEANISIFMPAWERVMCICVRVRFRLPLMLTELFNFQGICSTWYSLIQAFITSRMRTRCQLRESSPFMATTGS